MILYTIMPEHYIFPQEETEYNEQKVITYQGVDMVVKQGQRGKYEIVRVISSNPQHFLQFEPGQGIRLE